MRSQIMQSHGRTERLINDVVARRTTPKWMLKFEAEVKRTMG